jgi:hypothetical protein
MKIESKQLSRLLKFVLIGYTVQVGVEFGGSRHHVELTKKSVNGLLNETDSVNYTQDDENKIITITAA